jgi:hypothetical protein
MTDSFLVDGYATFFSLTVFHDNKNAPVGHASASPVRQILAFRGKINGILIAAQEASNVGEANRRSAA